ncbi:GNAT family N-acetyltransferase [Actinoallomurus sp. NPDC052308]|uniref:GNAT family N-acetyltransferase n=1 Tax=Actinoallomurus sp. NPDC052308 TaxID=3155530 RepID=UPI003434718D
MRTLETPRLVLRPLTADDFDEYAAMLADPEVGRHLFAEGGMSREDSWRSLALFLGHQQIRGYSNFAVTERDTGRFVGRVGPWRPLGWPGLEVGWCLVRRYWGKGYATEAARAAVRYCFDDLQATEVMSLIRVGNTRSVRVAERIGHEYRRDTDLRGVRCHVYSQFRHT